MGLTALSAGCSSGAVEIDAPTLSGTDAAACADLVDALPATLAGQEAAPVRPAGAPGAAWGSEEPVVLTCGVEVPEAYDDFSSCSVVGEVGWFLPPEELADTSSDITTTALTYSPRVSVRIPAEHRGSDEVQATVAAAIVATLTEGEPCL